MVTDSSGPTIEELMEAEGLVCLNNGQGTRVNLSNEGESAIDLTLVSTELVGASSWEVVKMTWWAVITIQLKLDFI